MKPEHTNPAVEDTTQVHKLKRLHQVTPLSKSLTILLLFILPFLGGWIGYAQQEVKYEYVYIESSRNLIQAIEAELADSRNINENARYQMNYVYLQDDSLRELLQSLQNIYDFDLFGCNPTQRHLGVALPTMSVFDKLKSTPTICSFPSATIYKISEGYYDLRFTQESAEEILGFIISLPDNSIVHSYAIEIDREKLQMVRTLYRPEDGRGKELFFQVVVYDKQVWLHDLTRGTKRMMHEETRPGIFLLARCGYSSCNKFWVGPNGDLYVPTVQNLVPLEFSDIRSKYNDTIRIKLPDDYKDYYSSRHYHEEQFPEAKSIIETYYE